MSSHGGPGRGMHQTEKARDFKGTMKKLIRYISAYKVSLVFVIIFAAGSTIFNIIGPKILGKCHHGNF